MLSTFPRLVLHHPFIVYVLLHIFFSFVLVIPSSHHLLLHLLLHLPPPPPPPPPSLIAQVTQGNVVKPFEGFQAYMNSKNYKEPEDGGQYGGRPAKLDSGRNVDSDEDDNFVL